MKHECDCCKKSIHFTTQWYEPDAGYGDDDRCGLTDNVIINDIICPVCGRIKEGAINKFGSIEAAFRWLIMQNIDQIDRDKVISIIGEDTYNNYKISLEINGITEEKLGRFVHSCGELLLETEAELIDVADLEKILVEHNKFYCNRCGDKILPIKRKVDGYTPEAMESFEYKTKRTK